MTIATTTFRFFRKLALAVPLVLGLVGLTVMGLPAVAQAQSNQTDDGITIQEPVTLQGGKNNTVTINFRDPIPAPDPFGGDPYEVHIGIYVVPPGETFDPAKVANYESLFGGTAKYVGFGGDHSFARSDYLPAKKVPPAGAKLVPYLETYQLSGYDTVLAERKIGVPLAYGKGDAKPPSVEQEVGSLEVLYRRKSDGQKLSGGDFEIKLKTGTGTKETLEKMPYGMYLLELSLTPEGYKPVGETKIKVDINKANPKATATFYFEKDEEVTPPRLKPIPFVNLTPEVAPDHPNVFIRIEDEQVHPVNGLKVSIVSPGGTRKEIIDAKLNPSEETQYKILALKLADFKFPNESEYGDFKVLLQQPGYLDTEVPQLIRQRSQRPIINPGTDGTVYLKDGKFRVKAAPETKLQVSFLKDPRLEDGIVTVAPERIKALGEGLYEVDFADLAADLAEHTVVKVLAQDPDRAPSDIVIVKLAAGSAPPAIDPNVSPTQPPADNGQVNKPHRNKQQKGQRVKTEKTKTTPGTELGRTGSSALGGGILASCLLAAGLVLVTRRLVGKAS